MLLRNLAAVPVLLTLACGPKGADSGADTDTSTATATTTDPTADPTAVTTTDDPGVTLAPDEQLCLDFCVNLLATTTLDSCGRADETCYDWCFRGLQFSDVCAAERRASLACEAMNPIDAGCEASACKAPYLDEEVCAGYCFHLGGNPGQGASTDSCNWNSTCYGTEIEMDCTLGAEPSCSCLVDGAELSTCTLAMPLKAFDCAGEDFHIFKGCCNDVFLEVLKP